jgi:hypothetical protein
MAVVNDLYSQALKRGLELARLALSIVEYAVYQSLH